MGFRTMGRIRISKKNVAHDYSPQIEDVDMFYADDQSVLSDKNDDGGMKLLSDLICIGHRYILEDLPSGILHKSITYKLTIPSAGCHPWCIYSPIPSWRG